MDTSCPLPVGSTSDYTQFPDRYYTIDLKRQIHLIEPGVVTYVGLLHELFTIDEMLTSENETLRMYGQGYTEGRYEYSS